MEEKPKNTSHRMCDRRTHEDCPSKLACLRSRCSENILFMSPCCLTQHCILCCISHSLCSCQLNRQQLKDGINSIAVILVLESMALNSFVLILLLFHIQNGMCGNVMVGLDEYVGRAIISVGIEK